MSNKTLNPGFENLTGFRGYIANIKRFSRNARLYLLHVIGMDLIHGTWEVLFNLYLLALGFGVEFIGLRLLIIGVAGAIASIPMGWLSDKIGRKAGFIIGDGGGAIMSLIQILSINPVVLLVAPAIGAIFGALHHVTEPPFMAENSKREERVHLFSVSDGLRTLSAMAGSLIAGFGPLWAAGYFGIDKVTAYRYAVFIGISWWFLSLIPAILLKPIVQEKVEEVREKTSRGLASIWQTMTSSIQNPLIIGKLLLITTLIAIGSGFVVPLFNVFFHEHIHAHEDAIGVTFAVGSLVLALATFGMPFLVERFGKVATVTFSRLAAIPFILVIGFAPNLADPTAIVSIAGLAYILRTTLFNMPSPIAAAFSMELLHPRERATATGLQSTAYRIAVAGAGFLGAMLMGAGDYQSPFFLMALFITLAIVLYWRLFKPYEQRLDSQAAEQKLKAETS